MLLIRDIKMFIEADRANLNLEVAVESDLEVDDNGNFYIVSFLYYNDVEEPAETRILFEDVIENLIDFYRDDSCNRQTGYGQLYAIANEMDRAVERLREVANLMEGRVINPDLFDNDDDLE